MVTNFHRVKLLICLIVFFLIVISFFIFQKVNKNNSTPQPSQPTQNQNNGSPEIIYTNPSPLQDAVLLPTQPIEITFNQPLYLAPEVRIVLDPETEFKVELINDNKTLRLTPTKSYLLGRGYTLYIKSDTKFDKGKTFGKDVLYGFRTIDYKGV